MLQARHPTLSLTCALNIAHLRVIDASNLPDTAKHAYIHININEEHHSYHWQQQFRSM